LQLVSRAVATRSAIQALSGVMLTAEGDKLTLSATDGEISIRSHLAAEVVTPGSALVPGRLVVDVLRSLSDNQATLERKGTGEVSISSGKAQFSLRALPSEDFPNLPEPAGDTAISLSADAFAGTIDKVARAASKDETRPVLTGVLVSATGPQLRMVATDSYRLSVKEAALSDAVASDFESNVPARALQELSRIVADIGAKSISLESRQNQIVFGVDRLMLASRVIDGQFPNYQQLIPDSFDHEINLSREEVLTVVRRISLMAQRNAPLRLKFEQGGLTVSAQTPDVGEASEALPVSYEGEALEIGFNPQFLQDGLESLSSDELILKLIHPHRPGLIEGVGSAKDEPEGRFSYLIMPVRLNA